MDLFAEISTLKGIEIVLRLNMKELNMFAGCIASGKIALGGIDLAVLITYMVVIVGIGCWAGLRRKGSSAGKDYFLAGGTLTWPNRAGAFFY